MQQTTLVIRPETPTCPVTEWCLSGQLYQSSGADALRQIGLLSGADNACLLLPVDGLIYRRCSIPPQKFNASSQAIAWLVEDSVIGDSEDIHWTMTQRHDEYADVVGVDKQRLRTLLEDCRHAGISVKAVVPDGLYLPVIEAGWSALRLNEHWLVRHSDYQWSMINDTALHPLFEHFSPPRLVCYSPPSSAFAAEYRDWRSPLAFYNERFSAPPLNLLHGEFRVKIPALGIPPTWRKGIISIATFALFSFFLTQTLVVWQQYSQKQQLTTSLRNTWQSYFPGDKRQGNYRFFFRQKVKQPAPDALIRLRQIEKLLQQVPGLQVARFSSNKETGELHLTLRAFIKQSIDQFLEISRDQLHLSLAQPAQGDVYHLQSEKNT